MSTLDARQQVQFALEYHQIGDLSAAEAAYRYAIQLDSGFAEAWNNLGNVLGDAGRLDEAIEAYRTALRLNPQLDRAYSNLGVALRDKGLLVEAIKAFDRAIELNPTSSIAHDNLGIALREHGEIAAAILAHDISIKLNPDSAPSHSNLSIALRAAGRLDDAVAAARKAISLDPNYPAAYNNLGVALADQCLPDEAIKAYCAALTLTPAYGDACTNLGTSLADKGDFARSLVLCQKAVDQDPANAHAHFNLAVILLLMGHFQRGWQEYEWRWKCKGLLPIRDFAQPRWDGGELNGRVLLVHCEQGLGDMIQFVRYIPLIASQGGPIVLECQPELARVLRKIPGVEKIVLVGESIPAFDVHCPIASLPYLLGTTEESIPPGGSYLAADPSITEQWRIRLAEQECPPDQGNRDTIRVGLAWAGKPAHRNDRNRSLRLSQLAPLATHAATFYSLQKGPAISQIAEAAGVFALTDFTSDLKDFADTAGLIANLDLVISVDTSVTHLAAAMGKPVWLMLPFNPDWRWLLDREDTPWYPTMRLFRQRASGDWDEVIGRVRDELEKFCSAASV